MNNKSYYKFLISTIITYATLLLMVTTLLAGCGRGPSISYLPPVCGIGFFINVDKVYKKNATTNAYDVLVPVGTYTEGTCKYEVGLDADNKGFVKEVP